jgi:HD-GYP domain-containing protein (c-di-GMP phosphodiesterase class II)
MRNPSEARILAIADVVESMISHRPYRAAHGIDAVLAEIEKSKGQLFDPAAGDTAWRCSGTSHSISGREK